MSRIIRRDQKWLSDWVKRGWMDSKEASELAALAYIEVPLTVNVDHVQMGNGGPIHEEFAKHVEEDKAKFLARVKGGDHSVDFTVQEFPLHECVFYDHDVKWYFRLKIEDQVYSLTVWECQENHQYYGDRFHLVFTVPQDSVMTPFAFTVQDHSDLQRFAKLGGFLVKPLPVTMLDNEHEALRALEYLKRWCIFNHQRDRYAVSVQAENANDRTLSMRRKQGGSVRVSFGPRIVYLDKLPVSRTETDGLPTGRTVEAHQRRGYWVTLKSVRFIKHRDYMKPKGHYRKPGWVGDRTTIVNGQVYTVIDNTSPYESDDD